MVFIDYLEAYEAVTPNEQHYTVGNEAGETAHIEHWNNTLRQRLARFVRKMLSFPKCIITHESCLKLFLYAIIRSYCQLVTMLPFSNQPLPFIVHSRHAGVQRERGLLIG